MRTSHRRKLSGMPQHMVLEARFHRWRYHVRSDERAPVFPDGCRDVLILQHPGAPETVTLTDIDVLPRLADLSAGTEISGYRLPPGGTLGSAALSEISRRSEKAGEIIGNDLVLSTDAQELISALARPSASVASVAADLGVSVRTFQRRLRDFALPAPDYWRLLARARRAATQLQDDVPLTAIACDCGYSDQAHMTREFQRWFSRTPAQMRARPDLLDLVFQPALGNWTGEQISTR